VFQIRIFVCLFLLCNGVLKKIKKQKNRTIIGFFFEHFWDAFWGLFWLHIGHRGGKMSQKRYQQLQRAKKLYSQKP
jgi:hypothetical protein